MSASPSGRSNDQTPTPNGGPPQFVRKQKTADPLRPRKKPVRRPTVFPPQPRAPQTNGPKPKAPNGYASAPSRGLGTQTGPANGSATPNTNGGWSTAPQGSYVDFPLVMTKKELREGLRYHIARFAVKRNPVDPTDQDQFTRPVVLHRRDPKRVGAVKEKEEEVTVDSKERERLEALKEEKERRKAEDEKLKAPTGNSASTVTAKKQKAFKNEKTTQIYSTVKNEDEKKARDLKYEEALPWHIEDADNKNTWVGNYEAALSDTNVLFFTDGPNFKMIPVEKWYRFTPKNQFKAYTIEEAEAKFSKKHKESRWSMKGNDAKIREAEEKESRRIAHGNFRSVKSESNTFKNSSRRELQDIDDLDFESKDLFQDDDEQATVEPDHDEDAKDAQDRIKRDQLAANVFDKAIEEEIEKEFAEVAEENEKKKVLGKKVKKALKKRERNLIYDSDSDHPYSSTSEDDTSDEEKQEEIDRKKDEEAKLKAKAESNKLQSGASSKGTNTPSGKPKQPDATKKPQGTKRPGSPNLSESSGNESTRKKSKKKHISSSHPTGTSTPIPGSRQISPTPVSQPAPGQASRKSSIVKLTVNSSKLTDIQNKPPNPSPAMSDGEATGGEMSDGGKKKKIKLRLSKGSPSGSRAGSPTLGRASSTGTGESRAGSPSVSSTVGGEPVRVTIDEIRNALPEEGISISALLKLFSSKIGDPDHGKMDKKIFIHMVRTYAHLGADKLLRPKERAE